MNRDKRGEVVQRETKENVERKDGVAETAIVERGECL